jgi:short-subunit dehydrogenase
LLALSNLPEQSTVVVILHSFDLIECSSFDSFRAKDFEHRTDLSAIRFKIVINSVFVSVAIFSECDSDESDQLIEVNFDSVLELEVKVLSQGIILEAVTECVDDVHIQHVSISDDEIEDILSRIECLEDCS